MDELDLGATIRGFSAGQKIFGRYTLKRLLGRGGMGVVWLARDESLEREVAVKLLPEMVANDPAAVRDLKRETSRSQLLSHPHILRIFDFAEGAGLCGITMELVEGGTLTAKRLDQPGEVFTVAQLEPWVRQLGEALAYAHDKVKIVHRDLKPANLMLTPDGDLKIADFGIAASVSDSVSRASRQASSSGTPVYMSPQQMMGEKPAVTDDIYSLGATLYELLTGKPPFYSGNVMMQVQNKVPPAIAERRKELEISSAPVPAEWEATIAACLAKEAKDRPQSAREVAEGLGLTSSLNAQRSTSSPEVKRAVAQPAPPPQSKVSNPKSKTSLYPALAAGVVLLTGLGYYFGIYAPEQELAKRQAAAIAEVNAQRDKIEQERATADALKLKTEQERGVAAAKAKAERLANARGGIVIRTTPSGAEVRVGAVALEKSPLTLKDQKLGKYPVKVSLPGYEDWSGEIEVKENVFSDLDVVLVQIMGKVEVRTEPAGAKFTIGLPDALRQWSGTSPAILEIPVDSGYVVKASLPGLDDVMSNWVEVKRNSSILVELKFAVSSTTQAAAATPQTAVEKWRAAADAGDAVAMTYLGYAYETGGGVPKDQAMAIAWYRKAAEKGEPTAMKNLGVLYASGRGVPKDEATAIEWYRKAADKGEAGAMTGLGVMYENGQGVPKDQVAATEWYRKAADKGDATGMKNLGVIYANGRGAPKDEATAIEWYRKAIEKGESSAMTCLGYAYETGGGVPKDQAMAVAWYRKAAEKGEPTAMKNLGVLYASGRGVPKDEATAVEWYRKAADKGEAGAMTGLGFMYENGQGVPKDQVAGTEWYRKAADKGDATAMKNLGVCYENGRGVPRDQAAAIEWYRKAARLGDQSARDNLTKKGLDW